MNKIVKLILIFIVTIILFLIFSNKIDNTFEKLLSTNKIIVKRFNGNQIIKTITDVNEIDNIINILIKAKIIEENILLPHPEFNLELYFDEELLEIVEVYTRAGLNIAFQNYSIDRYSVDMESLLKLIKN